MTKLEVSATIDVDITSSYTGYIYNENQNIWNASERVYSPEMKHFTSMDPEPGNVYEKMRVNPYVYAGNNPTTYIDLDGRFFSEIGSAIKGAFNWASNQVKNAYDWVKDKFNDAKDWVVDKVDSAVDAVTGTFNVVACALKSRDVQVALKLITGTLGLAIGVVAAVVTGGSALPIIGAVAAGTIMGGLEGAAGYTVSNAISGNEFSWDGLKNATVDGMIDGYMWGGISAGAAGFASGLYQTGATTAQHIDDAYYVGSSYTDDAIKGGGCFIAGTKVLTDDGYVDIEDIEPGDYVLAEDPEAGEQEYKEVVRTFIREKDTIVHVYVGDEEIETTEEHPFYVEETGWVAAGDLKEGDVIRTSEGEKISISKVEIEKIEGTVYVYNFEVEDYHTYYVSETSVLVHNQCWTKYDDIGNGKQYSVMYEANTGSGKSRSAHRNAANKQFYNQMKNDPEFKRSMDDYFGYDVMEHMKSGKSSLKNPSSDWAWHHSAANPDVIQLIPKNQHQASSLQSILHPGPNGEGGFGLYY